MHMNNTASSENAATYLLTNAVIQIEIYLVMLSIMMSFRISMIVNCPDFVETDVLPSVPRPSGHL